jgi:hypothetical protein
MSFGGLLRLMASTTCLESPAILISLMPSLRTWFIPCQSAKNSAWLLEAYPRPQAKDSLIEPLGSRSIPPPPALPGLPFEAPSNRSHQSSNDDLHLRNSCSGKRISQFLILGGMI